MLTIRENQLAMFAAILPNGPNPSQPLTNFAASVEEVQRRTGLDFFNELPTALQQQLESTIAPLEP